MAAVIWLVAGILLVAAELVSGSLVLLMIGGGALGAAAADALGAPVAVDVAVFAAVSLLLLLAARPMLQRRVHRGLDTRTNTAALVGGHAVVLSTVDAHSGRVKIGGDEWSARCYDRDQVLEPGRRVTVMDISGATAVVWGEL